MSDGIEKFALWGSGIDHELAFWRNWFATSGGQWPQDFQRRLDPAVEIDAGVLRLVGKDKIGSARILDVGCGPISVLGKMHAGQKIDIVGCDPLADHYAAIAAEHGVVRAIPVTKAFAEDLSAYFEPDQFDLIHCQNALDHSMEPLRAVLQMLIVAKPGGTVLLRHQLNEAENEAYAGFHQWNFDAENGRFIMWNKQSKLDVNEQVAPFADITVDKGAGLVVILRKREPVPALALTDARARTRELLEGAMMLSHQVSILAGMIARQGAHAASVETDEPADHPQQRHAVTERLLRLFKRNSSAARDGA